MFCREKGMGGSWPCSQMTAWRLGGNVPLLVNTWAKSGRKLMPSRINWSALKNNTVFKVQILSVELISEDIWRATGTGSRWHNYMLQQDGKSQHIQPCIRGSSSCVVSQLQTSHYSSAAALLGGTPWAVALLKSRGKSPHHQRIWGKWEWDFTRNPMTSNTHCFLALLCQYL